MGAYEQINTADSHKEKPILGSNFHLLIFPKVVGPFCVLVLRIPYAVLMTDSMNKAFALQALGYLTLEP